MLGTLLRRSSVCSLTIRRPPAAGRISVLQCNQRDSENDEREFPLPRFLVSATIPLLTVRLQSDYVKKGLACLVLLVSLAAAAISQTSPSATSIENLMDAGHWKSVRQIVDAGLKTNPNDPRLLYYSSKVLASFDQLEKALAVAERAVSADPRNPDYLAQSAEIHARLADRVSLVKQVSYVRSLKKELETALAVKPGHLDAMLVQIMFLSKAPMLAGGDRKRAHALANDLTRIHPTSGYLVQARLAEQENDESRIERSLLSAIASNPSFYQAQFYLGKFYCCVMAHPRSDAAEKLGHEMTRMDAGSAGGYDILARVAALREHWTELDSVLAEAEAKVPGDLSPYYQAANILLERGKELPRAERYLRKYLSQEPEGRQPTVFEGRQLLAAIANKNRKPIEAGF